MEFKRPSLRVSRSAPIGPLLVLLWRWWWICPQPEQDQNERLVTFRPCLSTTSKEELPSRCASAICLQRKRPSFKQRRRSRFQTSWPPKLLRHCLSTWNQQPHRLSGCAGSLPGNTRKMVVRRPSQGQCSWGTRIPAMNNVPLIRPLRPGRPDSCNSNLLLHWGFECTKEMSQVLSYSPGLILENCTASRPQKFVRLWDCPRSPSRK